MPGTSSPSAVPLRLFGALNVPYAAKLLSDWPARHTVGSLDVGVRSAAQVATKDTLSAISVWEGDAVVALDMVARNATKGEHLDSFLPSVVVYNDEKLMLAGPLYVVTRENGLLFADSPRTLLESKMVGRHANHEAVARFLHSSKDEGGVSDEGATFFEKIRLIPEGYVVLFSRTQRELRETETVHRAPSLPQAVRYSGGLAGAVSVCRYPHLPVYVPDFGPFVADETEHAASVLDILAPDSERRIVDLSADTLLANIADFVATMGEPEAHPISYARFAAARAAASDGVGVVVDPVVADATYRSSARRVARCLRTRFGVELLLPFVDAKPEPVVIPRQYRQFVDKRHPEVPLREWLLRLKNSVYEIFHSESFIRRPWWNPEEIRLAFEGFIRGAHEDPSLFWRVLMVELWAREFLDERKVEFTNRGPLDPNPDKSITINAGGGQWARVPVRTELFASGDDLPALIAKYVPRVIVAARRAFPESFTRQWYVVVSEKVVAVTQGRSFFIWDITPSWWARTLSKYVSRTPYGIGLGSPWTMQLAIDEAGLPRILAASVAGGVGKLFGRKGWFYTVAGHNVSAIDGPTEYSAYPANVSAKLPPADPSRVAAEIHRVLATVLEDQAPSAAETFGGCVVIDANDIGRDVLGATAGLQPEFFEEIFADNPLGQGREQTPIAVVFPM